MEFVVTRNNWVNGGNYHKRGESKLLNREGYMCCLGFCMIQLGYRKIDVFNKQTPKEVCNISSNIFVKEIFNGFINRDFTNRVMFINDKRDIEEEEIERLLTELFEKEGHSIKFK